MTGRTDKNSNMKDRIPQDDELSYLTDSDNSSTSSSDQVFEKNQLLVMDMHGMKRDELPDNPLPEVKIRKLLKKKRPRPEQQQSTGSLSSGSESSAVLPGPEKQEEFFDAHESYYDFPANQVSATAVVRPPTVKSNPGNPETLRIASARDTAEKDKRVPETTTPPVSAETTAAATPAVTQETATGQTPLTSAKPIRPGNPE